MTGARTVTWTPVPGVLFTKPETATGVAVHVSVTVTEQAAPGGAGSTGATASAGSTGSPAAKPIAVDHYTAAISPAQDVLTIGTDAGGVTVSAATLAGLFGIRHIDYRKDNRLHRVYDWGDLPQQCRLVAFKPSADTQATYTLTVTAHLVDGTTERATYTMIITQNWTAGRIRLEAAVDARR